MLRWVCEALLLPSTPKCERCGCKETDVRRLESRLCSLERSVHHQTQARPAHSSVQCVEQMLSVMERALCE